MTFDLKRVNWTIVVISAVVWWWIRARQREQVEAAYAASLKSLRR